MQYLRQSTASQEISLGYFLDSTDGNTEETALTIANTDIKIRKGGGTTLNSKNSGGATHISNGIYYATLDATDTNTLGMLEVYVHVSGALPVKSTYMVLPSATYDALVTNGLNDIAATDIVSSGAITTSSGAVSTVTTVGTVTTNTDLVTAAAIRAEIDSNSTQLAAIVADTNELQTNQGNWLTATGFSTHSAADVADAVWDEALAGHVTAGTYGKAVADIETDVTAILADTNELQTNQGNWLTATGFATSAALATVDSNVDAILVDTGTTLPATLTTIEGKIDTVDTNVDSILVDTGTDIPARFDGIEGATFDTATDSLEALRNRGDAAWTTGAGGTPPQLLQNTTIATLASQTSFTLTAGSADNDAYNGAVAVITDSATSTQKAVGSVLDYVGSTKTVTLAADPGIFTMAVGDTIDLIANASTAPTAAAVRAEIDANSTQLAAIVADTNELQTNQGNWLTATGFSTHSAADVWSVATRVLTANTNLNDPTAAAIADAVLDEALSGHTTAGTLGKAIADVETDVTAILVDTGTTLPATLTTIEGKVDTVDTNVDAILVDTGTTLDANITAIKAKTDSLTFTVAGQVDSNIQYVNDTQVTGDGGSGTEWGPV